MEPDAFYMRRALDLAERGRRTVSPNPLVGCVVVRDGEVVGEGWHERAGGPHAETIALSAAGQRARGATAYVTLEPCDHTGRTGPCTDALLAAGISRVVAAMDDPNPAATGGAAKLRSDGVEVVVGVERDAALRQNAIFLHGLAHGRPFVILKGAISLDGRIAAADGTSRWLTGERARYRAHEQRAEVDAIVVGSGTVLADDPGLTVRLPGYAGSQPLRVVLDARGRTPARARVLDGSAPTVVFTATPAEQLRACGADVDQVAAAPGGGVDLACVLDLLWARGVRSLLVEGGSAVAGAFVRKGLVDQLVVHVAPLLLGDGGLPWLRGGPATLADADRLRLVTVEQVGTDAVLTLEPTRGTARRSAASPVREEAV